MASELLDIVDSYDQVLYVVPRCELACQAHLLRNRRHFPRVVNAFLRHSNGKLWIPRRSRSKAAFPGGLDFSVGGYVASGESYETALNRECHEEINVDLTQCGYRESTYLNPHKHGVSSWMKVYEIPGDNRPNYNQADYCEWFWLAPEELLERIERGEPAKDDLARVVRHVYGVECVAFTACM